jgi:succinate-semialdehyde dehydrogenase/glutarate-semialdehyde dehydrogenase
MDNIVADNRIKAVTLTGSEGAGSAVASVAGENIKTSLLELGGSNAFVVLADADLDKAVEDAVFGRYQNTGQSCIAAKRLMIAEDIYDPFMQKFEAQVKDLQSGDPMDEEAFIGPLANSGFAEDLDEQVKKSIEAGAELRMGGQRGGAHYSPTILEDVKPGMPAFDEETFGPVAACMKFKNFNEAIDLVNRSKFGLGASVYTSDVVAILEDSKRIEDGAVFFNSFVKSDPRLPFGGTKKSGYGRELAREGILAFVNKKTTYIA